MYTKNILYIIISDVKHLTENVNLTSSEIFHFDVFDFQQRQNDVSNNILYEILY